MLESLKHLSYLGKLNIYLTTWIKVLVYLVKHILIT